MTHLLVGLGNPGKKYAMTRHNMGFLLVQAFAQANGWPFKKGWRIKGQFASGVVSNQSVQLFLPGSYMNLSGGPIQSAMRYYRVPPEKLLVVVDDIHLPFGAFRLKMGGSSGGHNGLKSIENSLNTKDYPRLRVGVGANKDLNKPLEVYVLENFSSYEKEKLQELEKRAAQLFESWLTSGSEKVCADAALFGNLE